MQNDYPLIKVLVKGYARQTEEGWRASSTCCYIESAGWKIITDPGCNRTALLEALARENLTTKSIDFVFLSHGHPDHTLLAGIFENARYITWDAHLLYSGDTMKVFDKNILGPHIEIIETPGHVPEHLSLMITTKKEKTAIAGDVFWWTDDEPQDTGIEKPDPYHPSEMNHGQLIDSRKRLLRYANVIIPGHGNVFRVSK